MAGKPDKPNAIRQEDVQDRLDEWAKGVQEFLDILKAPEPPAE